MQTKAQETDEFMANPIPVAGPWITQKEIDYVADAVATAWYGKAQKYNERFERGMAEFLGRKYAVSLPSCTSALHLSLHALGIGPGDEVITPEITWIATAAPIDYVGATPVFADIDERSWCLDPKSFEDHITPDTKAVIVVDLYGNMPDMDAILTIAERHKIAVIEDAAEALGSQCKGKRAGSFGQVSTFSFHGSKTLTTGEGGMLLTNDPLIYEKCVFLQNHGRDGGEKMFWNTEVAFKYRMSSMQAALGLAQLERIEHLISRKRAIFEWYKDALKGFHEITLNDQAHDVFNTYWMVTALLDPALGLRKEEFMALLKKRGVDTRPFFYPLSLLPAYQKRGQAQNAAAENPIAYSVSPYGVNLPSGYNVTPEIVNKVARAIRAVLSR